MLNTQLVYLQLDLLVVLQVPGGQVHQVDPSERKWYQNQPIEEWLFFT